MKKHIYICIIFLISSCSGNTKSTWSCPVLEGGNGNCMSIRDAALSLSDITPNKSVKDFNSSSQKIKINLIAPKFKDLKKIKQEESRNKIEESIAQRSKLRTQEKIGKVWFAPYIDTEGNQHSEKTIFVVDEEAKWAGQR